MAGENLRPEDREDREFEFSSADFERVRKLIYERAGISLNDSKQDMVYSRLARRLRATGLTRFKDYLGCWKTAMPTNGRHLPIR